MWGIVRGVVRGVGPARLAWRLGLQLVCYAVYFLQPVILRALLSAGPGGADGGWWLLAALAASLVMPAVVDLLNNSLMQGVRMQSKLVVLAEVASKPYAYTLRHSAAEVLSYVNEVSFALRNLEDRLVHVVVRTAAMTLLYVVTLGSYDVALGVGYAAFVAAYLAASARLVGGNRDNVRAALAATARANEGVQDLHRNADAVASLGTQALELERLGGVLGDEARAYRRTQARTDRASLAQQAIVVTLAAAVLWIAPAGGLSGPATQTALLTLLYSVLNLTGFGPQYLLVREMLDRASSAVRALELDREEREAPRRVWRPSAPALELRDVSFSFRGGPAGDGPAAPVVSHRTLSFPSGRVSALVGPNGSGKTTLLKIAAGLLVPDEGTVTLPCAEGDRVMYLDQGAQLFNRSLLENILYPDGTLSASEVMDLVREIGLDSAVASERDLERLTPGDLASRLSGGEQQKILVLRAIASRPRVLLCDEITSGLDPASADHFYRMVRAHLPGATVVCTVHRVNELGNFDEVVSTGPAAR